MAPEKIEVLVGGGLSLVREGYRALLEVDERLDVVGQATSGHHAMALAARTQPAVIVLDLELPGLDHRDGVTRVISHPFIVESAVLVTTPATNDPRVSAAVRAGAAGVLAQDTEPAMLRRAVRMIADGLSVLPQGVLESLIDDLPPSRADQAPGADRLQELTEREREVVSLVGRGLSNQQIAERLVITPATAKTHVSRAMTKLGARHRSQLVVIAYETGLVLPPVHAASAGIRLLAGA
jgi:DNA-binding NarL/FixJ family response regulator